MDSTYRVGNLGSFNVTRQVTGEVSLVEVFKALDKHSLALGARELAGYGAQGFCSTHTVPSHTTPLKNIEIATVGSEAEEPTTEVRLK